MAEEKGECPQLEKKLKYPKAVFLVIVNEICERFSFYGLRTILVLFLNEQLNLSQDDATIVFHAFNMTCYLFPVIGGIVSDSWLGKFRTILYLSLVYAVGNIVVSLAAWRQLGLPGLPVTCLGLLFIAMGTGGIKPCVSSFGGDQFVLPEQRHHLERFFSLFYLAINVGGVMSVFVTPELRTLPCLGADTCYPLAFGTPALLMLFFCGVFIAGRPLYVMKNPEGNVLVQVSKCIGSGLWHSIRHGSERTADSKEKKRHWLDAMIPRYGDQLVTDVKILLRLCVLAVPLPVFWALFDMQGSRWTFQARQLNGRVGNFTIKPDQMSMAGGVMVIFMLPFFEAFLHPLLARCGVLTTTLQRMSVGGLMAAAAFLCTAILQLNMERAAEDAAGQYGQIHVLWQLPQYFFIALADIWFAIAVLEFGYREAPLSMKSSITAIFQLTTSVGDVIVMVITETALFPDRTTEFFVYSGLMTFVMLIFIYMATRYTYVGDGVETTQAPPCSDTASSTGWKEEIVAHTGQSKAASVVSTT